MALPTLRAPAKRACDENAKAQQRTSGPRSEKMWCEQASSEAIHQPASAPRFLNAGNPDLCAPAGAKTAWSGSRVSRPHRLPGRSPARYCPP
jgi:hypothetical protein